MGWHIKVNRKNPGFIMICPGNPLHALMSILMLMTVKDIMMEAEDQEAEDQVVMEAMGKDRVILLDVCQ